MKNLIKFVLVAFALALALAACSDKVGEKVETIDFKIAQYPNFIKSVSGVSGEEPFGRWTDGGVATFKFTHELPHSFYLKLKAGAWGANLNQPIKFHIGSIEKEFIFKGDPFNAPSEAVLEFTINEPADTISINIPFPADDKNDTRKLGLGLISMTIEPKGKP